jgi:hypothetical protein
MKGLNIIILFMTYGLNLYSQKLEALEKVTVEDFFVKGDKSLYLYYSTLFSFPFRENEKLVGAFDFRFLLKNETLTRILINKNDSTSKFFAVHSFYNSAPELISVRLFYNLNSKIIPHSLEYSKIKFIKADSGYFLDLSQIEKNDNNFIIDIRFAYYIKSKKKINFYLDRRIDYKSLLIRIDIPEIYIYDTVYNKKYLTCEQNKTHSGPIIGWSHPGLRGTRFDSKAGMEKVQNLRKQSIKEVQNLSNRVYDIPSVTYNPCFCMIHPQSFKSLEYIVSDCDSGDKYPAIITLSLKEINEIKPN